MEEVVSLSPLKDLHELLGDSRKGYLEAAKNMKTPGLIGFLEGLSEQRRTMQNDLAEIIQRQRPEHIDLEHGSCKGELHRVWMGIREALSTSEDAAMLKECERGERFLLDRYSDLVAEPALPSDVLHLLQMQMTQVDVTLSTIEQLRVTTEPGQEDEELSSAEDEG